MNRLNHCNRNVFLISRNIFFIVLSIQCTSCSFNKIFLQPTKLKAGNYKYRLIDEVLRDTTFITFSGNNFQPKFYKADKITANNKFNVESVVFKNRFGNKLNGWLIKSNETKNTTITLLHLHGNEGSMMIQYGAIIPLLKNGIQIFMFDYSGFGFSDGKATQKNAFADANAALDYIKTREDVKSTKIIVYGQSFGGHLAGAFEPARQTGISGLVLEGAFSSPKDITANYLRKAIGIGFIARLLTRTNFSAKDSIKNNHIPLLIIHSKEDETVPFYMGQLLYSRANNPKQFYEIKGQHINGPKLNSDSIVNKIQGLLK